MSQTSSTSSVCLFTSLDKPLKKNSEPQDKSDQKKIKKSRNGKTLC